MEAIRIKAKKRTCTNNGTTHQQRNPTLCLRERLQACHEGHERRAQTNAHRV